jgi:hypothetical protein
MYACYAQLTGRTEAWAFLRLERGAQLWDGLTRCAVQVSEVKMVKGRPRTGEYDIYKVSFLREDGEPMLTCLLHGPEGNYEPGAIEAWEALRAKNGETVTVAK